MNEAYALAVHGGAGTIRRDALMLNAEIGDGRPVASGCRREALDGEATFG